MNHVNSSLCFFFCLICFTLVVSFSANAATQEKCAKNLNRQVLERSLSLGTQFLLKSQKPAGNFIYSYNWVKQKYKKGDSQVRQAGALWGLALLYQANPSDAVQKGLTRGLQFFATNSKKTKTGARYIVYPNNTVGRTGTVALVALAHIDYLRRAKALLPKASYQTYSAHLKEYLEFLLAAQQADGRWHGQYDLVTGNPFGKSSSYFDGEVLLALIKAAKYLDRADLILRVISAADVGYRKNIQQALQKDPDSKVTKGYYQWSSMAFYELYTSGWPNTKKYGNYLLDLTNWMVDIHRTLSRSKNTAYAYEGIIYAYQIAKLEKKAKLRSKFRCVIELGLEKLTSWQVGSPIADDFIKRNRTDDKKAIGGVQNQCCKAPLRIDVTQHQMHAVVLALRYVF